jgi:hypothetical protein
MKPSSLNSITRKFENSSATVPGGTAVIDSVDCPAQQQLHDKAGQLARLHQLVPNIESAATW